MKGECWRDKSWQMSKHQEVIYSEVFLNSRWFQDHLLISLFAKKNRNNQDQNNQEKNILVWSKCPLWRELKRKKDQDKVLNLAHFAYAIRTRRAHLAQTIFHSLGCLVLSARITALSTHTHTHTLVTDHRSYLQELLRCSTQHPQSGWKASSAPAKNLKVSQQTAWDPSRLCLIGKILVFLSSLRSCDESLPLSVCRIPWHSVRIQMKERQKEKKRTERFKDRERNEERKKERERERSSERSWCARQWLEAALAFLPQRILPRRVLFIPRSHPV